MRYASLVVVSRCSVVLTAEHINNAVSACNGTSLGSFEGLSGALLPLFPLSALPTESSLRSFATAFTGLAGSIRRYPPQDVSLLGAIIASVMTSGFSGHIPVFQNAAWMVSGFMVRR